MMYGGGGYSEYAYSDYTYTPLDGSAFEAFLAEIAAPRCWLLEMDAFSLASSGDLSAAYSAAGYGALGYSGAEAASSGGVSVQRFSTHGYISRETDTPASTWYDGRLKDGGVIERRIVGRDGMAGLTRSSAEVRLLNDDGALDMLKQNYALDGRRARLFIGRETDARSSFGVLFTGVVDQVTIGNVVTIRISDGARKLDVPVSSSTYAGTGNLEGGADLIGKPKPVGGGYSFNIAPPLVDSARLIYQVHDGAINDVPSAWDRQIALAKGADYASEADLLATAPAAGGYRVWKAGGLFRLGATPAGTVTCDLEGDASGSGFVNTTADLVLRLLVDKAQLFSDEIQPTSFGKLNGDAPAAVGYWTGTDVRTVGEQVDELLAGVGAFGGFSRHGTFNIGRVGSTVGIAPAATYTAEIIESVERQPLPPSLDPVAWRVRVGWQRNHTAQNDLAAAVSAARRTFAAQPYRFASNEDLAVRTRHLLAQDLGPIESLYALEADAQAEADRLFDLWSRGPGLFRIKCKAPAIARELGDVVMPVFPRHGFSLGRNVVVLQHQIKGSRVELLALAA